MPCFIEVLMISVRGIAMCVANSLMSFGGISPFGTAFLVFISFSFAATSKCEKCGKSSSMLLVQKARADMKAEAVVLLKADIFNMQINERIKVILGHNKKKLITGLINLKNRKLA